jgi:hypothetical protein
MAKSKTIKQRNRELAEAINAEVRTNPESPYAGKFVAIANGVVVMVSEDSAELARKLCAMEPDTRKTLVVQAGVSYGEIVEIWSLGECPAPDGSWSVVGQP